MERNYPVLSFQKLPEILELLTLEFELLLLVQMNMLPVVLKSMLLFQSNLLNFLHGDRKSTVLLRISLQVT
jgi:hypothetical protein